MTIALGFIMVFITVGIHFEVMKWATSATHRLSVSHRFRVAVGVLIALGSHMVEILVFAIGWIWLIRQGFVTLSVADPSFRDVVYFSASTYTSLGYGDIVPVDGARLLAGVEAVTGLVLIAWTASFSYYLMRIEWD